MWLPDLGGAFRGVQQRAPKTWWDLGRTNDSISDVEGSSLQEPLPLFSMPPFVITYSSQTLGLPDLRAPIPWGFQTLCFPGLGPPIPYRSQTLRLADPMAPRPCGFQTLGLPYLRAPRPCGFQTLGVHLEVCSKELQRPGGTWVEQTTQFPMWKAPVYKSHCHSSQCPLL